MSTWLTGEWNTKEYQDAKLKNFEILCKELESPPSRILDIGCGLAWESRLFNEKFGTELWLIDGDASTNEQKSKSASETNWHSTAESFLFYHKLDFLKEELDKRNTKNYHLIDVNNINIPDDIKFDVITSWLSCGFHYPASTYKDLVLKHSHENTRIFFDIRVHLKSKEIVYNDPNVEIVKILDTNRKRIMSEIKFK